MNIPDRQVNRHDWETLSPLAACVIASWVVDRAGAVVDHLESRLGWRSNRQMPLPTLLIGLEMLGMVGRRGHHRQVRLALRSLPLPVQRSLGVVQASGIPLSYRQVEKAMRQIAAILANPTVLVEHDHPVADIETGEVVSCPVSCPYVVADHDWFATAMAQASRPDDIPRALDMAIDWTDVETWAKWLFRFAPDAVRAPGDDPEEYHDAALAGASAPVKTPRARSSVAPIGPDGRSVPSKDKDGRMGHRAGRTGKSEFFIGWDLNTLIGLPGRDGTRFAPFLEAIALVPAASHPGDPIVKMLRLARHFGVTARDLVADRGYTSKDPERFCNPVRQLVDNIVLDLTDSQRKMLEDYTVVLGKGKPNERIIRILRIAGSFFADSLPEDFHDLQRPGVRATAAERRAAMKMFDQRAQYAFVRHDVLDSGSQRWAGPATRYAGFKVRCPNNERSLRAGHTRPLTTCIEGQPCSCGEVVVIDDPSTERERQELIWGTTEWNKSYNRRGAVERAYADDKFQVTNFGRDSIYCFGTVKHAIYYSPIIVARNIQVALRWYQDEKGTDPWGVEQIDRPDFRLPPELGGLHSVKDDEDPSGDDAPAAHSAPAGDAAVNAAPAGAHAPGSAPTPVDGDTSSEDGDVVELPDPPGLNRKQRRAAERGARRGPAKRQPPKPPPKGPPESSKP